MSVRMMMKHTDTPNPANMIPIRNREFAVFFSRWPIKLEAANPIPVMHSNRDTIRSDLCFPRYDERNEVISLKEWDVD